MAINSAKFSNLAGKSFNEIIVDGFKLFARNYGKLILPLAFFQILLIILDTLLLTDFKWYVESIGLNITDLYTDLADPTTITESDFNALTSFLLMNLVLLFLQNLIGAIIITIAMCSVSNYVYQKYMGEDVSFTESFKSAFNKKILIVILILGFLLSISSLLLFIPAIIIFGFFIFIVFTYNYENSNPIKEAKRISKGAFLKVIGVFVVNFIFIYVISFVYSTIIYTFLDADLAYQATINSWSNPATRNFGMIILYQIFFSIIDIFLAPLFICLLTTLFASLKARQDLGYYPKKGYYQESYPRREQESFELTRNLDITSQPNITLKERFYCPYCGNLIKNIKKFCPKCGESVIGLF